MNDVVTMVDRSAIRPSAVNPRKRFDPDKLNELAESIVAQGGIIYPLLVRPIPAEGEVLFELVAGERRWRASEIAGLKEVPCMVRQLSDRDAAELQLVENLQREDLTPVEEARGLSALLALYDGDTKAVAEKIGYREKYVSDRIRILALPEKALAAVEEGKLGVSLAEVISRVPSHEKQQEVIEEVIERQDYGEIMTREELEGIIRNRYMVELRGAPFSVKDSELLPDVGSCLDCPKRMLSGTAGKRGGASLCTDPDCFNRKREAAFVLAAEKAQESGLTVLSPEESAKQFDRGSSSPRYNSPYVLGADQPQNHEVKDELKRVPSWKKLANELGVPIVLAQDGRGHPIELVDRKSVIEAARAHADQAGREAAHEVEASGGGKADQKAAEKAKRTEVLIFKDRPDSPFNADYKYEQARAREKAKKDLVCGHAVLGAVVDRIEKRKPVPTFWTILLDLVLHNHVSHDACWLVVKRRGLVAKPNANGNGSIEAAVKKLAKGLEDDKERMALAVELLLANGTKWSGTRYEPLEDWCDAYDIDLKKVEREALAALRAKA